MNIIPYNPTNIQVSITEESDDSLSCADFQQILGKYKTPLVREAQRLYDMGLNVFPQPIGKKGGYAWKRLQYTRLNRDDRDFGIETLFAGSANLAIMCGRTSNNLFVIDCETKPALAYHMQKMQERNIPLWVVETVRGGHIYLRASNGEVHNQQLQDAEIKGCNGYVLAPPSIHPTGVRYKWVIQTSDEIPTINSYKVDWLIDADGLPTSLEIDDDYDYRPGKWSYDPISPSSNLSNRTWDYIRNGHTIAEGTRNDRLFAAACDLLGNHYTPSEVENILLPIALASGLNTYEIEQTLRSASSKERQPSRPETKTIDENLVWRYALLWGTSYKWHGRTQSTDRALFLALIERCRVASNDRDIFRASVRELAQLAKLGTNTVRKSITRLTNQNIIQRVGNDRGSGANLWQFNLKIIERGKKLELNMDTVSLPPHWIRYSDSLFNSEIVERGALGHSVTFVYQYLQTAEVPMMPSAIATVLGLSINQINYALRKLRDFDLLVRHSVGWFCKGISLAEIETRVFACVPNKQKSDRRKRRFARERQRFAGYLMLTSRYYADGHAYLQAIRREQECQKLLSDPLVQVGLELGGVIALESGGYLALR